MRETPVHSLGLRSIESVLGLGQIAVFAGQLGVAILTPPTRLRRLMEELHKTGVLSLAIVCSSGAAIGAVLALQGYNTLVTFGAEESLGTVVSLSLVREIGPVLTALLVTGRAGSAIAAEMGGMVATEQLDGLRMMSVHPVHFIATPKALSMFIAMPLLSGLFIVFGLLGGYLIGVQALGIDGGAYIAGMEQLEFSDDILGSLLKSVSFGILIGLISTYRGYTSAPNSEGVSRATTGAVVWGSVSIVIFDYVITALWGV